MKKNLAFFITLISILTVTAFATEPDIAVIKPIGEPSESGYQAYGLFDADGNPIQPTEREESISLFADPLPESYDSRDYGYISPVRNQGSFGTCWAHAFVACAEANMIKKGYEEQFNNYSELHLAYFYHKRNEAQGDGVDVFDSTYGYFGGGNGYYAAQFAESFQDLAVESDFPYSLASNSSDFSIDEHFRNHSDVHLIDYGKLDSAEDAKEAIMEYGAVSLGYASLDGYLSDDFGYYQNKYSGVTNHEVAVVGWDDNFPVESFNEGCRPSNPGAWLIKNSWGKMYGDFGYFWLSYEDPSILLGNYYEFEPVGDESKVHSYNGGVAGLMWEVPATANVFYAAEDQTLYAVGFDSATYNYVPGKYNIKIYVSSSKPSSPVKGTRKATLSGTITHDGFNHIELSAPIELKAGQYFSVVLEQTDSSGRYSSASLFEYGDDYSSNSGESYYYNNGRWYDAYGQSISGYALKNTTIKAYYKTDTATVTFNTRKSGEFDTVTVTVGECVERPEDPIMEGYEFLGWYTNNTVTEEWDFSTPVTHDMRLFAKWAEPENIDMKVKSRYFSTTFNPSMNVSAENIKNFCIYYAKDGKPYTYTATLNSSNLNTWYSFGAKPLGEYQVFTDVTGVNGEEITSDIETFTVTDQPALSVHEGNVNIVNIPESGVDLYVAQYDDGGNILSVTKRQFEQSSTDYISINAPTTYSNPRFFLWDTATTVPLCQPD